jgi:hypothetical protein
MGCTEPYVTDPKCLSPMFIWVTIEGEQVVVHADQRPGSVKAEIRFGLTSYAAHLSGCSKSEWDRYETFKSRLPSSCILCSNWSFWTLLSLLTLTSGVFRISFSSGHRDGITTRQSRLSFCLIYLYFSYPEYCHFLSKSQVDWITFRHFFRLLVLTDLSLLLDVLGECESNDINKLLWIIRSFC